MNKNDVFNCCNYKEEILIPVKIIPENRITGTVLLKFLKDKCPSPYYECLLYNCCFLFFPFAPCFSDCFSDWDLKSDSDGCRCYISDPNRYCCGIYPRSDCGCN